MNDHKLALLGLIFTGVLISACLSTQIPFAVPSVSVPSVPTFVVPSLSVPSLPTVSVPSFGLTLAAGAGSTPAPTAVSTQGVPVTGIAAQAAQWGLYALLLIIGLIVVIFAFSRFLKRTDDPEQRQPPQDRL